MPEKSTVQIVAKELSSHVAGMGAKPAREKMTDREASGLRCPCGWFALAEHKYAMRPWDKYHEHVARRVLALLEGTEALAETCRH